MKNITQKITSGFRRLIWRVQLLIDAPLAYREAVRLAEIIWRENYKNEAPNWKPLNHTAGVISQIDNMYAGVRDRLNTMKVSNFATIAVASEMLWPELRSTDGLDALDSRQRFVRHLQGMPPHGQANLLRIEHDDEVIALKATALIDQYFEVAAACALELKRRSSEQKSYT